jgi:hypothetical protein
MRLSGTTSLRALWDSALWSRMQRRYVWLAAALLALLAIIPIAASALSRGPIPSTYEVTGFSGHLGEWEMTATLARNGTSREFSGPLKMTHVGWCSQDGPEVKTGALSLKLAQLTSSIDMTVNVDGNPCTYRGRLSDAYEGTLICPDRRPVPLTLWLR